MTRPTTTNGCNETGLPGSVQRMVSVQLSRLKTVMAKWRGKMRQRDAEIERLKSELSKEKLRSQDLEWRLHRMLHGIVEYGPMDDVVAMTVRVNRRVAQEWPKVWDEAQKQLGEGLRRTLAR